MNHKSLKRYASNIAVTAVVIVIFTGVIEFGLAIFYPISYFTPPTIADGDTWRGLYHQASNIPGLTYEIAPNKGQHTNQRYNKEINSQGMRDAEEQTVDGKKACRVAVVGDSFTFGFGVGSSETYPNVLEKMLRRKNSREHIEVLNFGVGGYSTQDEALIVRHKVEKWNPQLIIIGYYLNDPDLNPPSPLYMYFKETAWWQHWNLLRLIAEAWQEFNVRMYGNGDYIRYLHSVSNPNWQSVVTAFSDISSSANSWSTPVLLVIFPDVHEYSWNDYPYTDLHHQVAAAGKNERFKVLDLYETLKHYSAKSIMVRAGDPHPSKLGHLVAASEIAKLIKKEDLLSCVM